MRNGLGPSLSSWHRGAVVLVFTYAASAGAHAGLVPGHLNGEPRLGAAFLVAVVLLVATGAGVAIRPRDRRVAGTAGLLLASLMLAYVASRTTGVPVLDPEPEALDTAGIATNAVEALGVIAALGLIHPVSRQRRLTPLQEVSR
jgi:hypothetical protein